MANKNSKKNTVSSVNSSANINSEKVTLQGKEYDLSKSPFTPCSRICLDDFPALPIMFDRLRRLNHAIDTLQSKRQQIEIAIDTAPKNMAVLSDEKRIADFIAHNAKIGVTIDRKSAMVALQIVRTNSSVVLDNTPKKRVIRSGKNEHGLSDIDQRYLDVFQTIGPVNISELPDTIRNSFNVHERTRFGTISKHIRVLQRKETSDSVIGQIVKDHGNMVTDEIVDTYDYDGSTISLAKRAIRIFNAMNAL